MWCYKKCIFPYFSWNLEEDFLKIFLYLTISENSPHTPFCAHPTLGDHEQTRIYTTWILSLKPSHIDTHKFFWQFGFLDYYSKYSYARFFQ